jgi:hypothetical protein
MLEEFKKKTNRTDSCGNGINMALAKCVSHELFVQCPDNLKNATNPDCAKLFEFAKTCPAYPFHKHGHCNKGKGGKSGEGEKGGKSSEGRGKGQKGGSNTDAPASNANPPAANTQSKDKQTNGKPAEKGSQANGKPADKGNQASNPSKGAADKNNQGKSADNKSNNGKAPTNAPPKKP